MVSVVLGRRLGRNVHRVLAVCIPEVLDACLAELERTGHRDLSVAPTPLEQVPTYGDALPFGVAVVLGAGHVVLGVYADATRAFEEVARKRHWWPARRIELWRLDQVARPYSWPRPASFVHLIVPVEEME